MKNKYLVLPVNNSAEYKKVVVYKNGAPAYSLDVRLNPSAPAYYSYVNIAFLGGDITVGLSENEYSFADSMPDDVYREPLRPQVHFSPRQGWNNDPNGLVLYEGRYHMFFQHNPAGNQWGNMHWGHAVSDDLLHWTELDIALYPDGFGTMYSGSAVIDEKNVSGLKVNEHAPLLLFYTAAGEPFTQCMAYSTDGGNTFVKYAANPVLPHIAAANRDPKVIWCAELGCYVMALYLDGNTYALFRSDDLLRWSEHQRFELPGDAECPDFYPLEVRSDALGDSVPEFYRWVFSGASDRYYIGGFEGGLFMPSYEAMSMHEGPNTLYAAQTFSGISGRRIRFSWDTSNAAAANNMRWGCQMSVPDEMTLRIIGDDMRLCCYPIREFDTLRCDISEAAAYDIEAELHLEENASFSVYGIEAPFECDAKKGGHIKMRIIADRTGFEAYFGRGEYYTACGGVSDFSKEALKVTGGDIESIKTYGLRSVLKK